MRNFTRQKLHVASLLLLSATIALSQETRGVISGHVTDSSSAAVAGAQVIVRNSGTNVSITVESSAEGYYEAPLLVAGNYIVIVEARGFKKEEQPSFVLPVGGRLEVNFKMEIGAVSETITVSGGAPLINVETLTTGTVRDSKSVSNLPWPGGNAVVLAMMTPGVQDTDSIADYSVRLHSGGPGVRALGYGGV